MNKKKKKKKKNIKMLEITASAAQGTSYSGTVNDLIVSPEYKTLDWRSRLVVKTAQLIGAGSMEISVEVSK